MTTTIYGNSGTYSIANATVPQAVVPANGEPVNAVPSGAAVQTVLDYVATVGQYAYNTQIYGATKISTSGTISSIRARTGMTDVDIFVAP